jgi:O-antigen/teichoic acid export membrane protein
VGSWPERAREAFERSTRLSSLVCGGLAAIAVPALTFAIPVIYGPEFELAAWVFTPLALASMFQSVNNPVSVFVNARERGGLRLKACAVALVVDVVAAVALIPPWGVWGAVVSNALGQLVAIGWLAAAEPFVKERGVRGFLHLQRAFIVGSAAMGGSLLVGVIVVNRSALLAIVVAFVVGAVLFVVGLRLLRCGLTTEDREALLQAVGESRRRYVVLLLRPVSAVTAR